MPVNRLDNWTPNIAGDAWIAPGAYVIGRVTIAECVGIWFNAVVRGDMADIDIGCETNVQDGSILHVDDGYPLRIGERVTVGHGATLHGCTIEDDVLVGMRATVLNGARIGRGSLIAAGALVREGQEIPPFSLVAGVPAVIKKTLEEEGTLTRHRSSAAHYVQEAAHYIKHLKSADTAATDRKADK
ncbi:MAG: gamma carbonic anhydrase family protein [bacterium]|nr:gamma carbonic anhydrase family protein [bacterium]